MEGRGWPLPENTLVTIGRGAGNDAILTHDPWVSSKHAELKWTGSELVLRDLRSSNGSFVKGKKVSPNIYYEVGEFFVVGSTIFKMVEDRPYCETGPAATISETGRRFMAHDYVRQALAEAHRTRAPLVGSLQLLSAFLEMEIPEVKRFLKSMGLDQHKITQRLDKLQLFEGEQRWLNEFLPYQYKLPNQNETLITPLIQEIFKDVQPGGEPVSFLKLMMNRIYNLTSPLLGLDEELHKDVNDYTDKVTLNPYDSEYKEIILPTRFWRNLGEELDNGGVVFLTGRAGCGKSTVMKQCFHALPKIDIPAFQTQKKRIFDPKVFLIFNEISGMPPYLNAVIETMKAEKLIGIDHFGFLLEVMGLNRINIKNLLAAIKSRKRATLLGISDHYLKAGLQHFPEARVVRLDDYLGKVGKDIFNNYILNFERAGKCEVSQAARQFLKSLLGENANYSGLETFLNYCSEQIQGVSFLYGELSWGGKDKMLSKTFFRMMLRDWRTAAQFGNGGSVTSGPVTAMRRTVKKEEKGGGEKEKVSKKED